VKKFSSRKQEAAIMKNILYVTYDGLTDPLGQSQVIPYLAGLSKHDHRIHIVSAEKEERFNAGRKKIEDQLGHAGITWHPVHYSNEIPGVSPLLTYRRLRSKSATIVKKFPVDVIHCRSYLPSLAGLELKRKEGIKFIFDMRGFWADERIEGHIWNLRNPFFRRAYYFFKEKEKQFLAESDAIISLTESAKNEILSWKEYNSGAEKISVIPCCADLDFFSEKNIEPAAKNLLRSKLGIAETDFVITYAGSTGTWYLVDEMFAFFTVVLKEKRNARFLFITPDDGEVIIKKAQQHGHIKNELIVLAAAREEMPILLTLSNAALFFIKPTFSKKASSPTKMGEALAMGIPVICNAGVGDAALIMKNPATGIVIPSMMTHHFEAAAKQLADSDFSKKYTREVAENYFSLDRGVEKYHKIYESL
jgi:glycosyltransferase involved in cell wall biosynthesis